MNLQLVVGSEENISAIQALARVIWNDHYPSIIGQDQVDYMLKVVPHFQVRVIHGHQYL